MVMYAKSAKIKDRRNRRLHPRHTRPELLARAPNERLEKCALCQGQDRRHYWFDASWADATISSVGNGVVLDRIPNAEISRARFDEHRAETDPITPI